MLAIRLEVIQFLEQPLLQAQAVILAIRQLVGTTQFLKLLTVTNVKILTFHLIWRIKNCIQTTATDKKWKLVN